MEMQMKLMLTREEVGKELKELHERANPYHKVTNVRITPHGDYLAELTLVERKEVPLAVDPLDPLPYGEGQETE